MYKRGYELVFSEDINQEADEPLDTINNALGIIFGDDCFIDWRDERCVEIHTNNVEVLVR